MLLAEETISSDIGKLCFVTQRVCFFYWRQGNWNKVCCVFKQLFWFVLNCMSWEFTCVLYECRLALYLWNACLWKVSKSGTGAQNMGNMFNVRHTRCGFIWPDFFWNPATPTPLLLFCNVVYWKTCSRRHLQKNLFFIPLSSWLWVNY